MYLSAMRYSASISTLTVVIFLLLAVAAVLGWMRPVRIVNAPDPYRVKFDSLQAATSRYQLTADSAMQEASYWRWMAEVLAAKRGDTPEHIATAGRMLNAAGLDSIRNVLLARP